MDGSCEIPSREGKEGFSLQGGEKIQNRLRLGGRARKSGGREGEAPAEPHGARTSEGDGSPGGAPLVNRLFKTEEDDETEDQDESEDEQETAVDNELSIGCSIKHLKSHGVMLLSQRVWRLSK